MSKVAGSPADGEKLKLRFAVYDVLCQFKP